MNFKEISRLRITRNAKYTSGIISYSHFTGKSYQSTNQVERSIAYKCSKQNVSKDNDKSEISIWSLFFLLKVRHPEIFNFVETFSNIVTSGLLYAMSKFHSFEKIEFKGLITNKIHIFHEISLQIRFNTISDTFFPNINSILLNYDGNMHILYMHIWRWHKVALEMVKFEDHFMPSPLESFTLCHLH